MENVTEERMTEAGFAVIQGIHSQFVRLKAVLQFVRFKIVSKLIYTFSVTILIFYCSVFIFLSLSHTQTQKCIKNIQRCTKKKLIKVLKVDRCSIKWKLNISVFYADLRLRLKDVRNINEYESQRYDHNIIDNRE